MLGFVGLAVEHEGEPAVQVGVVPEHLLDELGLEAKLRAEKGGVGRELDQRAVPLAGGGDDFRLLGEFAGDELDDLGLALAHGLGAVVGGQGVDRLLADAVEADGLLEGLGVVFGAGVDDGHAVHEFAQRDAPAVVAHAQGAVVELDLDFFAEAHGKLVDAVIDRLLEQHVDAVLGVGAIAEAADIHAGAETDVLEGGEGLDRGFGVGLGHGRHPSPRAESGKRKGRREGYQKCNAELKRPRARVFRHQKRKKPSLRLDFDNYQFKK